MSNLRTTAMAQSTSTDQRDSDSARAERIERHVARIMAALAATPDEQQVGLTPEQVIDLPMDELLTHVNGRLDTTEINEAGFFGYVTVTASGRITIYTPAGLDDDIRDAAIRYLITTHLGLSTHLLPDFLVATVFDIAGGEVRA
ncbi:hypothetical protein [Streptomyces sp. NPDC001221]